MPPVSVCTFATRHQFIGYRWSLLVSTRFCSCTPSNHRSGTRVVFPPASPLCEIRDNHSPARLPSPGSGKSWVNVQFSTLSYPVPFHTLVVMPVSRLVPQNVGLELAHGDPVHCSSQGV